MLKSRTGNLILTKGKNLPGNLKLRRHHAGSIAIRKTRLDALGRYFHILGALFWSPNERPGNFLSTQLWISLPTAFAKSIAQHQMGSISILSTNSAVKRKLGFEPGVAGWGARMCYAAPMDLTWLLNRQTRADSIGGHWGRLDDAVSLDPVVDLFGVGRHLDAVGTCSGRVWKTSGRGWS